MKFIVSFATIVGVLVTLLDSPGATNAYMCMQYCHNEYHPVCAYIGHGQMKTFKSPCDANNDACSKQVPNYHLAYPGFCKKNDMPKPRSFCMKYCNGVKIPVCAHTGHGHWQNFPSQCDAENDACSKTGYAVYKPMIHHPCPH